MNDMSQDLPGRNHDVVVNIFFWIGQKPRNVATWMAIRKQT